MTATARVDTAGGYPPISSLGALGDGHSMALVAPDGAVEWWCPLRFDADPWVWPLLDRSRGGRLQVSVAGGAADGFGYEPETAVLCWVWTAPGGRVEARAGMLWPQPPEGQQLVWHLACTDGEVAVDIAFDPRPGWGKAGRHVGPAGCGAAAEAEGLYGTVEGPAALSGDGAGLATRVRLSAGERLGVRVTAATNRHVPFEVCVPDDAERLLDATAAAWREWVEAITYDGPRRDAIVRSAITLKLLIYEPTGAVVAAATTSLPEEIGGVRNWDYRYTWLRDAGFTLNSLYALGCRAEAHDYAVWLLATIADAPLPLNVMYGIDGRADLAEREVADADGYRGSRPVRVGNAAERQLQLDSYGELLDCVAICEVMGDPVIRGEWGAFRRLVDFVADHWRDSDSGIWEVRDQPRHFTHSKAQAWCALDQGTRMAGAFGLDGDVDRWAKEARDLHADVLARGVHGDGWLTRAYGEDVTDASLLTLPALGFLPGTHPTVTATIDAAVAQLSPPDAVHRGLLRRYPTGAGDGLPGEEGAFTLCSFWLVDALDQAGRHHDAAELFDQLCDLAGPPGLFAEMIDPPSGAHLGNYPQAFTHIGLINAGLRLGRQTAREAHHTGPSPKRATTGGDPP